MQARHMVRTTAFWQVVRALVAWTSTRPERDWPQGDLVVKLVITALKEDEKSTVEDDNGDGSNGSGGGGGGGGNSVALTSHGGEIAEALAVALSLTSPGFPELLVCTEGLCKAQCSVASLQQQIDTTPTTDMKLAQVGTMLAVVVAELTRQLPMQRNHKKLFHAVIAKVLPLVVLQRSLGADSWGLECFVTVVLMDTEHLGAYRIAVEKVLSP
jgi:hypothetical protein